MKVSEFMGYLSLSAWEGCRWGILCGVTPFVVGVSCRKIAVICCCYAVVECVGTFFVIMQQHRRAFENISKRKLVFAVMFVTVYSVPLLSKRLSCDLYVSVAESLYYVVCGGLLFRFMGLKNDIISCFTNYS